MIEDRSVTCITLSRSCPGQIQSKGRSRTPLSFLFMISLSEMFNSA